MKTRKLYTIRANARTIGRRLRSLAAAKRAVRTLRKMGRDAHLAPVAVNADEFDGNGRRIRAAAPAACVLGRTDIALNL